MKTAVLFTLLASFAFGQQTPKFDWVKDDEVKLELKPGEVRTLTVGIIGITRIAVDADNAPVSFGVISQEPQFAARAPLCVFTGAFKAKADCTLDGDQQLLLVKDNRPSLKSTDANEQSRAMGDRLSGLLAAWAAKRKPSEQTQRIAAEKMGLPNRVTLTSFRWQCISNCP